MLEAHRTAQGAAAETARDQHRIAVLVPCYNEQTTVGDVVAGFRAALPEAEIYVYDNNSTDGTVEAASAASALVRGETHQGKGHVVRRMFAELEADIYVLVDGVTYLEQGVVPRLPTALLSTGLMLVAFLSFVCGLILDTVTRGRRETKRLAHLMQRSPGASRV